MDRGLSGFCKEARRCARLGHSDEMNTTRCNCRRERFDENEKSLCSLRGLLNLISALDSRLSLTYDTSDLYPLGRMSEMDLHQINAGSRLFYSAFGLVVFAAVEYWEKAVAQSGNPAALSMRRAAST